MKYYSTITNQLYDSPDELHERENAFKKEEERKALKQKKRQEERKLRAKEVDDAYHEAVEAYNKYILLKKKYNKDYGFRKEADEDSYSIFDIFKFF